MLDRYSSLRERVQRARLDTGPPPVNGPIRTAEGWYGAMLVELAEALRADPDIRMLSTGYTGEMVYARYGGDRIAFTPH